MFLYDKTNILEGSGIFEVDFAPNHGPANVQVTESSEWQQLRLDWAICYETALDQGRWGKCILPLQVTNRNVTSMTKHLLNIILDVFYL